MKIVTIICDECGGVVSEDDNQYAEHIHDTTTSKKGAVFEIEIRLSGISRSDDGNEYNLCATCQSSILTKFTKTKFTKKPMMRDIEAQMREACKDKTKIDPLAPLG